LKIEENPIDLNFKERERFAQIPDGENLASILENGINLNESVQIS